MRTLIRNKQTIHYKNYSSASAATDSYGLLTGEDAVSYGDLTKIQCYVSPASGLASQQIFGIETNYSKVILTDDMNCGLDEYSIVWIDKPTTGPHDYVVARKSVSLNYIAYGLVEVNVGSQV